MAVEEAQKDCAKDGLLYLYVSHDRQVFGAVHYRCLETAPRKTSVAKQQPQQGNANAEADEPLCTPEERRKMLAANLSTSVIERTCGPGSSAPVVTSKGLNGRLDDMFAEQPDGGGVK